MPFVITHWINLAAMCLLIITGLLIHFPVPISMGIARGIHIFCGFVIFINCIVRMIMAFFVESAPTGGTRETVKDYKTWLPQADNKHQGAEWVKYYTFVKKDHPLGAKLGVPQKLSYLLIPILLIFMFITGICLWPPTAASGFCQWWLNLLGGAMSVRVIHYFMMYVFIIFMFIHVHLATAEGTEPVKLMFLHKEHGGLVYDPEKHVIVGEDKMAGHE